MKFFISKFENKKNVIHIKESVYLTINEKPQNLTNYVFPTDMK